MFKQMLFKLFIVVNALSDSQLGMAFQLKEGLCHKHNIKNPTGRMQSSWQFTSMTEKHLQLYEIFSFQVLPNTPHSL